MLVSCDPFRRPNPWIEDHLSQLPTLLLPEHNSKCRPCNGACLLYDIDDFTSKLLPLLSLNISETISC